MCGQQAAEVAPEDEVAPAHVDKVNPTVAGRIGDVIHDEEVEVAHEDGIGREIVIGRDPRRRDQSDAIRDHIAIHLIDMDAVDLDRPALINLYQILVQENQINEVTGEESQDREDPAAHLIIICVIENVIECDREVDQLRLL